MEARYIRNLPALSEKECALLRAKRVCVVGCGGLGGYVVELLARIGVGALTVVDGDSFDATNLNRQLLSDEASLGQNKAAAAARRIAQINSGVAVRAAETPFTAENGAALLSGCDLAIDALDNIASRKTLAAVCAELGLYLVHGAISGWMAQAALLSPGSDMLEKLYPPGGTAPDTGGNPGFAASFCASMQVAEAVKRLCGRESALLDRLLIMDMKAPGFTIIDI